MKINLLLVFIICSFFITSCATTGGVIGRTLTKPPSKTIPPKSTTSPSPGN